MKEFINNHTKLYWTIVVTIAVLAFAIVTCIGCSKLERAEAATTSDGTYYPAVKDVDWNGFTETLNKAISECDLFWVSKESDVYYYGFADSSKIADASTLQDAYSEYCLKVSYLFSVTGSSMKASGCFNYASNPNLRRVAMKTTGEVYLIGTNFIIQGANGLNLPCNNLVHPKDYKETLFASDAPYVTYDKVNVVNKLADGSAKSKLFSDIYEDYTKTSYWEYVGYIENMSPAEDLEYFLEVDFTVELPADAYIYDIAAKAGIDIDKESQAIKYTPDMVTTWNLDSRAKKEIYEFTYGFTVEPDLDGYFTYRLSFDEIEGLLQYFNESARERIMGYEDMNTRAFLMAYLHIDTVSTVVRTTRSDSIVYGKGVINIFDRGIYDVCVEIAPDIDYENSTEEEIDKIIQDATDSAYEDYRKELEERVEGLEKELGNLSNSFGSFDVEFEGNGLWSAIKNMGSGLVGLTGFLGTIAGVFGGIFAFLPYDFQQIAGYFLIASLLIALWKLIKR